MKFSSIFALSALLLFTGCATWEFPLGISESQWKSQLISVRVLEKEGDMQVYEAGGMYYYFKSGILVYQGKNHAPIASIVPAAPAQVYTATVRETPRPAQVARTTAPRQASLKNGPQVRQPEEMNAAVAAAFNAGDLEQLLALYDFDAVVVPLAGQTLASQTSVRAVLEQFLQLKGKMQARNISVTRTNNLAMIQGELRLSFTDDNGSSIERTVRTAEVIRQHPDGSWLYVFGQPFFP